MGWVSEPNVLTIQLFIFDTFTNRPWQPCPVTCRKNEDLIEPMKRRTIMCVDQHEFALPSEQCVGQERPIDIETCSSVLPICSNDEYHNNDDPDDNFIDNEITN